MISMARILGAPDSIPAGKVDHKASSADRSDRSVPVTSETMCITCEKRSTSSSLAYVDRSGDANPSQIVPR